MMVLKLRRTKNVLLISVGLIMAACYPRVSVENVRTISDADLCVANTATAASGWELARQEILRRGLLTQEELRLVDNRTIRVGMPECGLLAMKGYPRPPRWCGKINTSGGSYGTHRQYVYRPCGSYGTTTYVYVENGRVSSWQNW